MTGLAITSLGGIPFRGAFVLPALSAISAFARSTSVFISGFRKARQTNLVYLVKQYRVGTPIDPDNCSKTVRAACRQQAGRSRSPYARVRAGAPRANRTDTHPVMRSPATQPSR